MGKLMEKTRYLGYIGVFSLLFAALAALGWGVVKTVNAISIITPVTAKIRILRFYSSKWLTVS